jgi:L-2-hydroxyglutarate oxidase LhgO
MTALGLRAEVAVIGGGVIGCAVAAALAAAGRQVLVLERERALGTGVTSRNSGVIHSGLYYPPGSLKALSCVRGNAALYQWATAHDVWHAKTGKLVIARQAHQVGELEALAANARAAGAAGVTMLAAEAAERAADVGPLKAALFCAETGIIDVHELVLSLRAAAERGGATFVLGAEVTGVEGGTRLETTRGELWAEQVVNAAGLHADEVAQLFGVTGFTVFPCRGDYFRLRARRSYPHLIYPVKDPHAPGLGVHLTLERGGGVRLGPDTEWVQARDDFGPAPHKHAAFHAAAQRLLGPLDPGDLTYDGCGIRPKLRGPNDAEEKDFALLEQPRGVVHLIGIESPGLTAALDLAARVVARLA